MPFSIKAHVVVPSTPPPVIAQMSTQSTERKQAAPLAGTPAADRKPFVQPAVEDLGGMTEKTQQLGGSGA